MAQKLKIPPTKSVLLTLKRQVTFLVQGHAMLERKRELLTRLVYERLAQYRILRTEVRALGPDTWRVRFAVANAGYLPSYVSKRAIERKTVRGTVFTIHLPEGASLVSGKPREVAGHLEGHAPKSSQQAFLPTRELTGDRAVIELTAKTPAHAREMDPASNGARAKLEQWSAQKRRSLSRPPCLPRRS